MMKEHYDVAVLGCWWGANYGSVLNGYSVYKVLKSMDLSVLMVQKHNAQKDDWEITNTHNARFIEKFYSEDDAKQGYIILNGDDNAGKRVNLVSTSIGIISSELENYSTVNSAMNALLATCKLAKMNEKSSYLVERAKLSAQNAILNKEYNNKILIIEPDEALNFLLKTTGEMQGYEVATVLDYDNAMHMIKTFEPALIVLDAGDTETLVGIELCKKIKKDNKYKDIKIIVSTIVHDKKMVLNTGADLYLPKPYELLGIFSRIEHFVKEYNGN